MRKIPIIMMALCMGLIWGCTDSEDEVTGPAVKNDTIHVSVNAPTIQAAIDMADSQGVIIVAEGIYSGDGNRDIDFSGKSITLKSVNGPEMTIIDCGGTDIEPHFGLMLFGRENDALIDGFTIRGGYSNHGAGINLSSSSPTIKNCILTGNHATISGGAIRCKSSSPLFINCTFVGNSSDMVGGAVHVIAGSSPVFENCIISFSPEGEAVYSSDGSSIPVFRCSDIYGNAGGDWVDVISDQEGLDGNICLDPLFCDLDGDDFGLMPQSPCAASNNTCDSLIGALPAGCGK